MTAPPPNQFAGFFNFALRQRLVSKFVEYRTKPLLRQLSLFQVESNIPQVRVDNTPPEIAVLHNILTRGLPTVPSLFVEDKLQRLLGFTSKNEEHGSISFDLVRGDDETFLEEVFTALHIVDKRLDLSRTNYRRLKELDSEFEKSVFFDQTTGFEYFRQLFEPQVTLEKITGGITHLANQRVDFGFTTPYFEEAQINGYKKSGLRGFILEADGPHHAQLAHILLDERRDAEAKRHAWETFRTPNLAGATAAFGRIAEHEFVKRTAAHFNKNLEGDWLNILQLALTPFAIARLQKVILDAALSGYLSLESEQWKIVIVERDVPCAHVGIADLQETMRQLFRLSGREQCPEIVLEKVFVSAEFKSAALHDGNPVTVGEKNDGTPCDLLVDISMLRRDGLESIHHEGHNTIVRSARWPEYDRRVISAPRIEYRNVWQKKETSGEPIPDTSKALEFFLQNLFRKNEFREGQLPILQRALKGQTVVGLLPTGGGKSLTYQLAALLQPGTTLVIDPIRSLMKDQVDGLNRIGIDACHLINSSISTDEKKLALHDLEQGRVLFSLVSPERLLMEEFRNPLKRMAEAGRAFSYCVIDEAHCVSEWGHDFRTAYLALGKNARQHARSFGDTEEKPAGHSPLFGLTATASFDVLSDVERELEIQDADAVVRAEYSLRAEIQYEVVEVNVSFPKDEAFTITLAGNRTFSPKPVIGEAKDIKEFVAAEKMAALNKLLKDIPRLFGQYNDENAIKTIWEEAQSIVSDKEGPSEDFSMTLERIRYPTSADEKLSKNNAGLIFVPHRTGVFGVTEKFKPDMGPNGVPILNAAGKPKPLPPEKRKSIADGLAPAGFWEAIPEDLPNNHPDLHKYVGTFMGASDADERTGKRIDKDSFHNQDLFLNNQLKLMVATKAFGMGIDKPNIRFTVHFNIPASPEGFVQECGRAGRDRHLALAFILYNKQKLYGFDKKTIDSRSLPPRLRYRWFEESDFRALLNFLDIKEEPKAIAQVLEVDRSLPEFFHKNSFKGPEKEKAMVQELLEKITFPKKPDTASWDTAIEENIGQVVKTTYWEKEAEGKFRVYVKGSNEEEFGHLDIADKWKSKMAGVHQDLLDELRRIIEQENDGLPALTDFKDKYAKIPQEGILKHLTTDEMPVGSKKEILVGFANQYECAGDQISEMTGFLGLEDMNAPERIGKALERTDTYEQFLEALTTTDAANWSPDIDHQLRTLYYARRLKADTDKAIYRLVCAGIVEDWTVDFNQKMYTLTIRKKQPEEYVEALFDYVRRYHAEQRALNEVLDCFGAKLKNTNKTLSRDNLDLPNKEIKSILTKSLYFLIDFAYREVAAKRLNAIGDIVEACEEYLGKEAEAKGAGNFALKTWIYLYFNSKYARARYEAKLSKKAINLNVLANFSLLDDTEAGRGELLFERLLQYLNLMDWDTSGSNNDNIKHLRGATTRLLRDRPDNASLKLLKAFTLFVLASDNPVLYQEAEQACTEGFQHFIPEDDPKAVENLIRQYSERVLRYMPEIGREKVRQFLENLSNAILLNHHLEWLKTFNSKFLNEFDYGHYKDLAGTAK